MEGRFDGVPLFLLSGPLPAGTVETKRRRGTMVKRICVLFTAAVMTLSVLLCGCEAEERGEVILIGSAGADVGSSASGDRKSVV